MRFITGPPTAVENGSKSVSDVPIAGTETCLTTYTGTGTHMYMVNIWNLDRLCRRHEEAGTPAKQLQDSILRNIIRYLQIREVSMYCCHVLASRSIVDLPPRLSPDMLTTTLTPRRTSKSQSVTGYIYLSVDDLK